MTRRRDARGRFVSAATIRRSLAARRAWVARKAQARKRSDAARKGWKTRRRATFGLKREKIKSAKRAGRTMAQAERAREKIHGKTADKEYVLAVKYKSKRGARHNGTVQASIFAPPGTSKADLKKAVVSALTGRATKYQVRVIEWKSRRSDR